MSDSGYGGSEPSQDKYEEDTERNLRVQDGEEQDWQQQRRQEQEDMGSSGSKAQGDITIQNNDTDAGPGSIVNVGVANNLTRTEKIRIANQKTKAAVGSFVNAGLFDPESIVNMFKTLTLAPKDAHARDSAPPE